MATYEPTQTQDVIPVQVLTDAEIAAGNYRLLGREPMFITGDSIGGGGVSEAELWAAMAGATVGTDAQYATLAAALTAGETFIALKPGTYTGTVNITQSNVTIVGYGATWTENVAAHTLNVTGTNVRIEGITFQGSHDGAEGSLSGNSAIRMTTGTRLSVYRCRFINLKGWAITGQGSHDSVITHCYFANVATDPDDDFLTQYCLYFEGDTLRLRIAHNYFTGWSQAIGLWYGTSYCVVESNALIDNYGYVSGLVVRSAIENFGATGWCAENRFVNNYVDGTTSACFEIAQGSSGVIVEGNTCKNAIGVTIGVVGGDGGAGGNIDKNIRIVNNDIYGNGDASTDGCLQSGTTDDVTWQGNRFYDHQNGTSTLFIFGTEHTGTRVIANTFRGCNGEIIRVQADGVLVEGNDIESAEASTKGFRAESTNYHRIVNNRIVTTNRTMEPGSYSLIQSNNLSTPADRVIAAGHYCQIMDNTTDNTIPSGEGFALTMGDGCLIRGNRFNHTGAGGGMFILNNGVENIVAENRFERADDSEIMRFQSSSRRNVVTNNFIKHGGTALNITDQDATGSNVIEGNHNNVAARWQIGKALGAQTVGTSEATIAHGLGYAPTEVRITCTNDGNVWESTAADATSIFLTASAAGRTAKVWVR